MRPTTLWLWPNLLSLDAPLVALVWQDFAAHTFGHPLRLPARVVLALTVWAIYVVDRLLDTRASGRIPDTARHNFYRRHRRAFSVLLAVALSVDLVMAVEELRRAVFEHGLLLGGLVAAYLLIFPLRSSGWEKQIAAAILFSVGALIVTSTWISPWTLLLPGLLFAGLCLCNLVLIELWEGGRLNGFVWLAPVALAILALVYHVDTWHRAIATSAVLMAAVAISGPRLSVDAKHVLADVALLAPLLFRLN
jgi:hypothetical protein